MFRMLTGQLPFDLKLSTTLLRHQLSSPTPPPSWLCDELDPNVEAIVLKAMRKNPANRYASALELAEDLALVQSGHAPRAAFSALAKRAGRAGSCNTRRCPRYGSRSASLKCWLLRRQLRQQERAQLDQVSLVTSEARYDVALGPLSNFAYEVRAHAVVRQNDRDAAAASRPLLQARDVLAQAPVLAAPKILAPARLHSQDARAFRSSREKTRPRPRASRHRRATRTTNASSMKPRSSRPSGIRIQRFEQVVERRSGLPLQDGSTLCFQHRGQRARVVGQRAEPIREGVETAGFERCHGIFRSIKSRPRCKDELFAEPRHTALAAHSRQRSYAPPRRRAQPARAPKPAPEIDWHRGVPRADEYRPRKSEPMAT